MAAYASGIGARKRLCAVLRLILIGLFVCSSVLQNPRPASAGDAVWQPVDPLPARAVSAQTATAWTAYNDCQHLAGQPSSGITTFNCHSDSANNPLIRYADSSSTGVTFDVAIASVTPQNTSATWGVHPTAGDAATIFPATLISMVGGVRMSLSTGYVQLTFEGLSPGSTYSFVTSANSGNSSYASRITTFAISGMDSATNTSSAGTVVSPQTTAFSTGQNTTTGYVARWENIDPGADGSFVVTATSANGGYGPAVFLLSEEASSAPSIHTSGALTAFSAPAGAPSAEQSYTVAASNLTEDLLITAPEGFGLSAASGGPYTDTLSLTPTGGEISATSVYVRFYRATMGVSNGAITHASAGAYPVELPVSGTAYGPEITTTGSLAFFTAAGGAPSPLQSYRVSGNHLESDVIITAPAGFEISTAADSGFGQTLALSPSAGSLVDTAVYVRLNRAVAGNSSGSIIHESSGAETRALAATGAAYSWRAYNDCSVAGVANPDRTNEIQCSISAPASALQDFDTGSILPASVAVNSVSTFAATTGLIPNAGTDAYATFYELANITGNVRMTIPTASVALTITNLNPEHTYTFAATANRGSASDSSDTRVIVEDVDNAALTNASTTGAQITAATIPGDTTIFDGGENTASGYVARWTGIQPGADGDFSVRFSVIDTQAYGPSVFLLAEESNTVPSITVSGALAAFTSTRNAPSTVQSYTVAGRHLGGGITITAPAGFEVSTASTDGFAASLALPTVDGVVEETGIYVRFVLSAGGAFSGEILHSSPGAPSRAVAVSGEASANEAPAAPELVRPGDTATGIAPTVTLEVTLSDPNRDPAAVSFYGRRTPQVGDDGDPFVVIGSADSVASGDSASITWGALAYSTAYEWYVTASDGTALTASPTWRFTTQPMPNQPPVIQEGETVAVPMSEDGAPLAFALNLHASDANPGDTLEWSIASAAANGLAAVSGSGASVDVHYTPTADYHGSDSFILQVADSAGAEDSIRVDVIVAPVNDAPVILGQAILSIAEDTSLEIEWSDLTVTDVDNTYPAGFSLSILPGPNYTASDATLTPAMNFYGTLTVPVSVHDGADSSNTFDLLVTVQPVNDPPAVSPMSIVIDEDVPTQIILTSFDIDDIQREYQIVSGPTRGTLSGWPPILTYIPHANNRADDSFTFRVFDGEAYSQPAVVSISIRPEVNQPPVIAEGDSILVPMSEDGQPLAFGLTLHASDANRAEILQWSVLSNPAHGAAQASGAGTARVVTYMPEADSHGADSFVIQVQDGQGASDSITVNVSVESVNDHPIAQVHPFSTDEDTPGAVTLSGTDAEKSSLSYEILTAPAAGSLSGTAPNLTYTPQPNVNGVDSFTFRVFDGEDYSASVLFALTINPVNDAPQITEGEGSAVTMSLGGSPIAFALTLHASDVDEDAVLDWSIATQAAHGFASADGSGTAIPVAYTPLPGYTGADSFVVRVSDGLGGEDTIIIHVSIVANPVITTTGSLSPFTTRPGKPSAVQSYMVSGENLFSPVVVTAPAGFQVSLFSDILFRDSLVLAINNGTLGATQIYVRYLPDHEGAVSTAIMNENPCADTVSVPVSGSAYYLRFYLPLVPLSRTP